MIIGAVLPVLILIGLGGRVLGQVIPPSYPDGALVSDGLGNFWGTTTGGGMDGYGTIYKINQGTGAVTTVVTFDNGSSAGDNSRGSQLAAALVSDGAGNFWGTASQGGVYSAGGGTVFKVNVATGAITTVVDFNGSNGVSTAGNARGATPQAALVSDGAGNLWGTTTYGGLNSGVGTVFKVNVSTGAITTVADFDRSNSVGDNARGAFPYGGLVSDAEGNFWGTTSGGGINNQGTVFKINQSTGAITTVADFGTGNARGNSPLAGLVSDGAGYFWGTTYQGGASEFGTVFKINQSTGAVTTVVDFDDSFSGSDNARGAWPQAALVSDGAGNLWGTTDIGGATGLGTVFKVNQSTGVITTVVDFDGMASQADNARGDEPESALVSDGAGNLWGTTFLGGLTGMNGNGTVFKVSETSGDITTVTDFNLYVVDDFAVTTSGSSMLITPPGKRWQ